MDIIIIIIDQTANIQSNISNIKSKYENLRRKKKPTYFLLCLLMNFIIILLFFIINLIYISTITLLTKL